MATKLKLTDLVMVTILPLQLICCLQSVAAQGALDLIYSTADMDDFNAPFGFRPGSPTQNNSCQDVREVPQSLRSAENLKPEGLDDFYQKYTEAYGIPVVGSSQVSDSALSRACYTLRFLLADNSQIRKWFYYLSGRVAVIGKDEETTDLPEKSHLPDSYNTRARGLGGRPDSPAGSAGEENMLCLAEDRYWTEDILIHETAHSVHRLGAAFAIPDFNDKLDSLYDRAKTIGLWNNTYMWSTTGEMLAEAVQTFFNVNDYSETPNGVHGPISTREKLRKYDPGLYKLIKEIFPCGNTYLKRCDSDRQQEDAQQLRMNCDLDSSGTIDDGSSDDDDVDCKDNDPIINCWSWATNGGCDVSRYYMNVNCRKTCKICDVRQMDDETALNCVNKNDKCDDWAGIGECLKNPLYMLNSCRKSCNAC